MDWKYCRCGCGAWVRNLYVQGHDAKHISYLLRINASDLTAAKELTPALLSRYQNLRDNRVAKRMPRVR